MTSEGGNKLTMDDALAYLQDKREKYDTFRRTIKDFKEQRIDIENLMATMKEIFKGHRDILSWEDQIQEATNFLNKLKTRFQGDDRVYNLVVAMLRTHDIMVIPKIATLLQDHADLHEEFIQFFSGITTVQQMHVDKDDFLSISPEKKRPGVFLKRNIRKYGCSDEISSQTMEGLQIINGLECILDCISSKVSYVLDTEDVLIRMRSKRRIDRDPVLNPFQVYTQRQKRPRRGPDTALGKN